MIGEILTLRRNEDGRGHLVAIEGDQTIPFPIKRVYYLTALKGEHPRGFHAHRNLKQFMVCVHGSCRLTLDNGSEKQEIVLNQSNQGVIIQSMVWRVMDRFTADCVLMVLANEHYDESDYIRDYETFINEVRQ